MSRATHSRHLAALAMAVTASCGASLRDGVFTKDGLRYAVSAPDETSWKKVDFADNDLAWINKAGGQVLAMNATCKDHGDPSLEILTSHLVFGFERRELVERKAEQLDGREALRTVLRATLDGVPVELELLVLKKNGCVHDFSLVAPPGKREAARADFERLVRGFKQEPPR